jgi:hyperosmotically inducible periplasmic protein
MTDMKKFGAALLTAVLATGLTAFAGTNAKVRDDSAIRAEVAHQLQKKSELSGVQASVRDGLVTLQGSVDSYKSKLAAEKAARKADHIAGVRDLVQVNAAAVSDAELQEKIAKTLRYERSGFTNVFDAYMVGVKDGVVTIAGEAYTPYDKQLALDDIANTKGVRDVIDKVQVSPTSIFDDGIRRQLVRAIYGSPSGFRYGIDPQAPIRIVVHNGHVGLYGVVDSEVDRTVAGMRARQVFGVFDVENHLQTPKDLSR